MPTTALEQSAAVFIGRVVSVEKRGSSNKFQFKVSTKWKGVEGNTASIVSNESSEACGIKFDSNRDYLVYAFKNKGDNQLRTNLCTRTKRISDASADLNALGKPTIYGSQTEGAINYRENLVYGMEMQLNSPEITRLQQTFSANPNSRMFRLSWPVKGTDAITALYDRAHGTLKFYSKLHGATRTTVKSVEFSGVTDEVLAQWAANHKPPGQLDLITKYGAVEENSAKRTIARSR